MRFLACAFLLHGCGLLLDLDPPETDQDASPDVHAPDVGDDTNAAPDVGVDGGTPADAPVLVDAEVPADTGLGEIDAARACADPETDCKVPPQCQRNICVDGQCDTEPHDSISMCDDGDPCTLDDACSDGVCRGGGCEGLNQADQPCKVGTCTPGGCRLTDRRDGIECAVSQTATLECNSGSCEVASCIPNHDDCNGRPLDGCESDLSVLGNCGECGETCEMTSLPLGSVRACEATEGCSFACLGARIFCGDVGACLDLQTNSENCGVCGNDCDNGLACVAGRCIL